MSKNVVLFVDGTWNSPSGAGNTPTNVVKLYEQVGIGGSQVTEYLAGIGTGEFEDIGEPSPRSSMGRLISRITRLVRPVLALPFGRGTKRRITRAYKFLADHYEAGDHVFLFGFSRGAFAARSLAGFVDAIGLLLKEKTDFVEQAYALYENGTDPQQSELDRFLRRMTGAGRPVGDNVAVLPIYFIGVWDTVAALGLPRHMQRFSAKWTEYHQTELPSNVTHARHALALHELRTDYPPLLWSGCSPDNPNQTLKQVWFSGAHADVGGGYRDHQLSDVGCAWMAREAKAVGLQLNTPSEGDRLVSPTAVLHHERRHVFALSKPIIRDALSHRDRLETRTLDTFSVHQSVLQRLLGRPAPDYGFRSARVNATLSTIDEISLQLHFELAFRSEHSLNMHEREWWKEIQVKDVAGCPDRVRHFITADGRASDQDREFFRKYFCLWVLCGGEGVADTVWNMVEQMSNSREAELLQPDHNKLDVLSAWAQRLGAVATEVALADPLLPSPQRAETIDLADRLKQLAGRLNTDLGAMRVRRGTRRPIPAPPPASFRPSRHPRG